MAVIVSALLGNGSKGKVGNTVLRNNTTADGQRRVIATEYQPNVANPQSEGQMYRRILLGTSTRLVSSLNQVPFMKELYTQRVGNKSYFNWQVQNLLRATGIETVPVQEGGIADTGQVASASDIAIAEVRWTQGQLSFRQPTYTSVSFNANTVLFEDVSFDEALGPFDTENDLLVGWAINLQSGVCKTVNTERLRGDFDVPGGTAYNIQLETMEVAGDEVQVVGFSFFRMDANGKKWSQISYPAAFVNSEGATALPAVLNNAYNGAANKTPPPAPIFGGGA